MASGFGLSVASNIAQVVRQTRDIERRALPQATRNALNDTAFEIRKGVVDHTYPAAFEVRNARFAGASFRVAKASKTRLAARVADVLGRGNLELHAKGGTRLPRGRHVAVPIEARRTGSGRIRKADRPREVLGSERGFVLQSRRGPLIVRRKRGRGAGLEALFGLETSVRLPKRFPFFEDAQRTARARFPGNFRREWRKSLARLKRT